MADGRPAYRVNGARGERPRSLALISSAAVAVVDAELGLPHRMDAR
jgi:hypothetical protein